MQPRLYKAIETAVKVCYAGWSRTYYDEYYGSQAAYPPVHRTLLRHLLLEAKVRDVLDAGCGPASFLRELTGEGIEVYGFDLTTEMVFEARKVLEAQGVPPDHIWEGSVLSPDSFRVPRSGRRKLFDAAICVGVLPHIPEEADTEAIRNLRNAVKKNGLVIIEARNRLFALFTLNRYSHQFFLDELMRVERLEKQAGKQAPQLRRALAGIAQHFRTDVPAVRRGRAGRPGYDEVLSRAHNPFVLKEQFAAAGFQDVRLLFYHYHCLPPMFASALPDLFRQESLAMEDPTDWRGYFMASAFLLAGRRS